MNVSKRNVRNHFDRHARQYDKYAKIQRELAEWLLDRLDPQASRVHRILEIGCGTGYLTERIRRLYPQAAIVAVDIAPRMLELARARVGEDPVVLFLEHDIDNSLTGPPLTFGNDCEPGFDLIISSGTLQWLEDPAKTLRLLETILLPGGRIHAGIFGKETFFELRESFAQASKGVGQWSHGPALRSADDWEKVFHAAGFVPTLIKHYRKREVYADVRTFLNGIRQSGANNAATSSAICRRPSVVRKMMEIYEERFGTPNGVYATWEWVCVTAGSEAGAPKTESVPPRNGDTCESSSLSR